MRAMSVSQTNRLATKKKVLQTIVVVLGYAFFLRNAKGATKFGRWASSFVWTIQHDPVEAVVFAVAVGVQGLMIMAAGLDGTACTEFFINKINVEMVLLPIILGAWRWHLLRLNRIMFAQAASESRKAALALA